MEQRGLPSSLDEEIQRMETSRLLAEAELRALKEAIKLRNEMEKTIAEDIRRQTLMNPSGRRYTSPSPRRSVDGRSYHSPVQSPESAAKPPAKPAWRDAGSDPIPSEAGSPPRRGQSSPPPQRRPSEEVGKELFQRGKEFIEKKQKAIQKKASECWAEEGVQEKPSITTMGRQQRKTEKKVNDKDMVQRFYTGGMAFKQQHEKKLQRKREEQITEEGLQSKPRITAFARKLRPECPADKVGETMFKRGMEFQKANTHRLMKKKKEVEQEESEELSFKPKINESSRFMGEPPRKDAPLWLLYDKGRSYQAERDRRIEKKKKEVEMELLEEVRRKPEICSRSRKLASRAAGKSLQAASSPRRSPPIRPQQQPPSPITSPQSTCIHPRPEDKVFEDIPDFAPPSLDEVINKMRLRHEMQQYGF